MKADSFAAFIWRDATHRRYLLTAVGVSIAILAIFKLFYPYPNLVYDSYYYVLAAALDRSVSAWPLGYSRFLYYAGFISHSHLFFVCLQYLLLELSCLLFFFTTLFFFRPGKGVTFVVFIFLFFNPLLLLVSNFLQSDALFITLSILWATQLCWIICRPRPYMILTHALLLVMVFSVRYNALYYPLIGAVAFILSRQPLRLKWMGIILPLLLVGSFVIYTAGQVGAVTGKKQFSPLGGWKIANVALYAYPYIKPVALELVPEKFRSLDSTVREYFAKGPVNDPGVLSAGDFTFGGYYLFSPGSPLLSYMHHLYGNQKEWHFLNSKRFLSLGPLYQEYGNYLIRQYPAAFTRYYIWPNFLRYSKPFLEIFEDEGSFELNTSYSGGVVDKWLGLETLHVDSALVNFWKGVLSPFSILFSVIHLFFVLSLIGFMLYGGFKRQNKPFSSCLKMIALLWLTDLVFSVIASPVNLRYEIFIVIVEVTFGAYFLEEVIQPLPHPGQPAL